MTRILLVDDVKLFRHLEASILSWRGYTIVEASSGAEALDKIRSQPPDLALIDLYMPGMNGLEVCRQIKQDPALRSIPVIMVTSSGRDDDIRKAIEAGCDDYMTKPLEDATLVRKVEDLLGEGSKRRYPRVPASMQISFEDFRGIFFEFTRDISRTGVFVEMDEPLPVGTQLRLSFSLPPPFSHPVMAYGRVVRAVAKTSDRPGGMGVSFMLLNEQSERVIDALVASQSEYEKETGVFSRVSYQEDAGTAVPASQDSVRLAALREERDEIQSSFAELQREHMRMSALLTLTESLHSETAPKMLLAVALDVLSDILGASACGIFVINPSDNRLIPANSRGLPALVLDQMPLDGPVRQAIEDRKLQVPVPPWVIGPAAEVLAVAPVLHGKTCLGVVTIHSLFAQKAVLNVHDHQLLESLGVHLGQALVNSVARLQADGKLELSDIIKVAGFGR